jgi:hypothetical protein
MPLDPIVLATITSAVSVLGTEYLKGAASEAGKSTWIAIRSLFGWKDDPSPADIPQKVATSLISSSELPQKVYELLKTSHSVGVARSMVEKIDAEKVIVIETMHGNVTM